MTARIHIQRSTIVACLVLALALALCAFGGRAGATQAKRPVVSVKTVGTPLGTNLRGSTFDATGVIANGGSAAARKVLLVVRLRSDDGKQRRIARRVLGGVAAGARRDFTRSLPIPASFAPGSYDVVFCVPKRGTKGKTTCRVSRGPLTVIAAPVTPVPPPVIPPVTPPVDPPVDPPDYQPGARSLGDVLFPEIGNGGYDASGYAIDLEYDPATNAFALGTSTTMTATATQDLSEFSMDFEGLTVDAVEIDGQPATFTRQEPADCSPEGSDATTCEATKLVITPAAPGIVDGTEFEVEVSYAGIPEEHTDADDSIEGWIRACTDAGDPGTCDGAFVVNQPIGAQTWFPSNNHPADKATFETAITVPGTHSAFGVGELESEVDNLDGTKTVTWLEDDPAPTYLTTATVGLFALTESTMTEDTTGQALPVTIAVDSSCSAPEQIAAQASLGETPQIINFFNDVYGTYPYDSTGAVVDRTDGVGYALEVLTKPHYASCTGAVRSTVVHELAHQWFGNTATLATWSDIWFNEGWAQWSDWYHTLPGTATPAVAEANFQTEYNDGNDEKWAIAPAVLDGDPANLFAFFPTYTRGAMTLEGYRQIVGDTKYFEFARRLLTDYRYANIGTRQVIALALEVSAFRAEREALLTEYFEQWLYGTERPALTPDSF